MNYEILKHVIITSPQTIGPHTCPGPYQRRCGCAADFSSLYILSLLDSPLRAGWVEQGGGIEPSRLWAREGKNHGLESHVWLERWDWQSQAGVEPFTGWTATHSVPLLCGGWLLRQQGMDSAGGVGRRSQGGWAGSERSWLWRVGRQ